jgi:uncharacterized protein YlzI (FlbEa/FlbD family)
MLKFTIMTTGNTVLVNPDYVEMAQSVDFQQPEGAETKTATKLLLTGGHIIFVNESIDAVESALPSKIESYDLMIQKHVDVLMSSKALQQS